MLWMVKIFFPTNPFEIAVERICFFLFIPFSPNSCKQKIQDVIKSNKNSRQKLITMSKEMVIIKCHYFLLFKSLTGFFLPHFFEGIPSYSDLSISTWGQKFTWKGKLGFFFNSKNIPSLLDVIKCQPGAWGLYQIFIHSRFPDVINNEPT